METMTDLFNKTSWRLGRWIVTTAVLLFFLFRSPTSGQSIPLFLLIIPVCMLAPEIARFWSSLSARAAVISLISDAVVVCIFSTVFDQGLIILLFPLIAASISIPDWYYPPLLSLVGLVFSTIGIVMDVNNRSPLSIALYSFIFLLTGIVSDVIRRHLAQEAAVREKLEKKLEKRSDYFLMRAHEIRTPLSLVRASVELILDGAPGPLTDQQQVFLENIDENTQHIALLAENMLTKSKLESGVFHPTFQPTDIRDPIRAVVTDMRTFATRRNQEIHVYYPQILPLISIDSVLLRQALTNLIRNAIQHTSSGGQIAVSIARNDLNLLVSVTDDGAGMSIEKRKQIFRRFATGRGGTGLGLMIVKHIIELHGGQVYIDTSLGRGTTFMLTFPFPDNEVECQL